MVNLVLEMLQAGSVGRVVSSGEGRHPARQWEIGSRATGGAGHGERVRKL